MYSYNKHLVFKLCIYRLTSIFNTSLWEIAMLYSNALDQLSKLPWVDYKDPNLVPSSITGQVPVMFYYNARIDDDENIVVDPDFLMEVEAGHCSNWPHRPIGTVVLVKMDLTRYAGSPFLAIRYEKK